MVKTLKKYSYLHKFGIIIKKMNLVKKMFDVMYIFFLQVVIYAIPTYLLLYD